MSISKIFIPNSLCVFSHNKDRKHIEHNFHSVARVMSRGGTCGCWGVKNFSVGICDGATSTARSSLCCNDFPPFFNIFILIFMNAQIMQIR